MSSPDHLFSHHHDVMQSTVILAVHAPASGGSRVAFHGIFLTLVSRTQLQSIAVHVRLSWVSRSFASHFAFAPGTSTIAAHAGHPAAGAAFLFFLPGASAETLATLLTGSLHQQTA